MLDDHAIHNLGLYLLNSMPLISAYDGLDAFEQLYQRRVTSYSLVVKRGTTTLTFSYVLD